jgi:glycosyltransferase involved in cell wall biosynthesis
MLEGLAARGHAVRAVSTTVFDQPRFATSSEFIRHIGARQVPDDSARGTWGVARGGVMYLIAPSRAQRRFDLTCAEAMAFQHAMKAAVKRRRPDVVMAYGGRPVDRDNYRWLRDRNIPIIFYVANPNYRDRDTFRDIDLMVTDTEATANLYKARLGMAPLPIGKAIKPFPRSAEAERDRVTFINPAPEKGAAIFIALVQETLRRGLDTKFLVVESRKHLSVTVSALGMSPAALRNVEYLPLQESMTEVWRRTRVLLHPSLWHESGPRVILEACSAAVPVIATSSGGVPELLGNGGTLLPVPPELTKTYLVPASAATAKIWADALEPLLTDDQLYAAASERAHAHWQSWSEGDAVSKLEAAMKALIAQARARRAVSPEEPLAGEQPTSEADAAMEMAEP